MNDKTANYCDVLSAAVGLTSQKSGHEMIHFMLNWMSSWDFTVCAELYEVYKNAGKAENQNITLRQFTEELPTERIHDIESGLIECALNKKTTAIDSDEGQTNMYFPVESSAGPMRIIKIQGQAELDPNQRVLCMHLVTLFTNQINVFDEKERDQLTGLLNRQTFDSLLFKIISSIGKDSENERQSFIAVLDIDHFKRVNDTYGHLYGDEVLLHFSQIMERRFRYTDYLFRFGGEEFIVLLNGTNRKGAETALERFRTDIESYMFPAVGKVTVSSGCTQIDSGVLPTTLIDMADKALYEAKETGRNKVVFYEAEIEDSDQESEVELF